ncbi:CCR4-NOT transcription complex subunit 2-like isoform X3 [Pecten maximus]|uniref:CCR4-NOT transcription complex subunit 2-like isoform X3 n=1 Tax=Pecten maximus TaxID=6579 RepID=UPI001458FC5E|nr:CCR4-NOT transcription complex subunit 2-like isoform X3 [Pecten maximus]
MAAFRNNLDSSVNNMAGMGQFMTDQFSWNSQYGLNNLGRKTTGELSPGARKNLNMSGMSSQPPQPNQPPHPSQPSKPRKGLFGEDDDSETSMYFPPSSGLQSSVFRPDRDVMNSQSPSQLSGGFGSSNFYNQGGLNNYALQPRGPVSGVTGPQFRGTSQGHVTPTSMNPNFPMNLQQPPQQPSPNRNVISAIGGQRSVMNQNQGSQSLSNLQKRALGQSGLPNSSTPLSSLNNNYNFGQSSRQIFGTDDSSQPGLDLSEFPTLGNRNNMPSNPIPAARNYGKFGMVSKPVMDQTPEFQIQQEDFPALPGAQNPPSSSAGDGARKTPTSIASGTYEQAVSKDGKFPGDKSNNAQSKRGIQTHPDGTVSNIPTGMVTDQFGIVGLLTFIRAAENDPNLVALAPGIDLTTLGLNLNSPENLYSTFQSPWVDLPCRPQDIDFHVPAEYLTNIFIRDKLAPVKLNRYGEDLLFYLFYMNGGDVLQLAAAFELYTRDWRYHKEERVWITRAPGLDPIVKTNTYERGTYYFFEAQGWRKVPKEFHLEYDKLEERPTLPSTLHHSAS